jgi:hypothetical protein
MRHMEENNGNVCLNHRAQPGEEKYEQRREHYLLDLSLFFPQVQ